MVADVDFGFALLADVDFALDVDLVRTEEGVMLPPMGGGRAEEQ